jgi:hypothetical protein
MVREQRRDSRDPGDDSVSVTARPKSGLHIAADRFPFRGLNLGVDASVGDDLDVVVSQ